MGSDMACKFPLMFEPSITIGYHAFVGWCFPMCNFMGFEFTFKVATVVAFFTLISPLVMTVHVTVQARCQTEDAVAYSTHLWSMVSFVMVVQFMHTGFSNSANSAFVGTFRFRLFL